MATTNPPSELGTTLKLPSQYDLAYMLGANRGLAERAAGWGEPDPMPLSGVWADDPVIATLARSVGVIPPSDKDQPDEIFEAYAEQCANIAERYEEGYLHGWGIEVAE